MRGSKELGRQRVRGNYDRDTLYTCMDFLNSIYGKRRKDNRKETNEGMKHKNHSLAMLI